MAVIWIFGNVETGYGPIGGVLMAKGAFEFWFPVDFDQFARDAGIRANWFKLYNDAARTLHQLDARREPYAIELEVVEPPANRDVSLLESCVSLLGALRSVPSPTEQDGYAARWLTQFHTTLRLANEDSGERLRVRVAAELAVQPAGTLLVDLQDEASIDSAELAPLSDSWTRSIQNTLAQNPLARAGAEYAVAIDLPTEPGLPGRDTLIGSAFQMLGQISTLLPTEQGRTPTFHELWINLTSYPGEPTLRVRSRIWRLGYMKIAGQTRMA
jgi:hypothetical protein